MDFRLEWICSNFRFGCDFCPSRPNPVGPDSAPLRPRRRLLDRRESWGRTNCGRGKSRRDRPDLTGACEAERLTTRDMAWKPTRRNFRTLTRLFRNRSTQRRLPQDDAPLRSRFCEELATFNWMGLTRRGWRGPREMGGSGRCWGMKRETCLRCPYRRTLAGLSKL